VSSEHDHDDGHERPPDDAHDGGAHGHSHTTFDHELVTHRRAIRAIWVSVVGLGLTAAFQLAIVALSDSVSLFADALHNVGDVAGTALLWVGFTLSRRPASDRFPYGWRRAEDLAGLFIVLAIAVSAGLALWDATSALLGGGHEVRNFAVAFAAALVGAVGNEAVAVYKIRVGRDIGSVPLVADGEHARVDGLVSLAAAGGIGGAWLGFPIADPLVGLGIGLLILRILWSTAREVLQRNLDGVDPSIVGRVREVAAAVDGVESVHDVRARHGGRALFLQLHLDVDGHRTLAEAHAIGEVVRHELAHTWPDLVAVDIHLDPVGVDHDPHADTAHHFGGTPADPTGGGPTGQ
jgi:cation diffusion facilitator family transporter